MFYQDTPKVSALPINTFLWNKNDFKISPISLNKHSFGTLYQSCPGNFLASKTATLANTLVATPPVCCHYSRRILFCKTVHRGVYASLLSGGLVTVIVVNPAERKLAKCTSVQWSDSCGGPLCSIWV